MFKYVLKTQKIPIIKFLTAITFGIEFYHVFIWCCIYTTCSSIFLLFKYCKHWKYKWKRCTKKNVVNNLDKSSLWAP